MTRTTQLLVLTCLLLHFGYARASSEKQSHDYEPGEDKYSGFKSNHIMAEKNIPQILARHNSEDKQRSPEQRRRTEQRKKRFESMSPEEKQRIREARHRFKELPPNKRKQLKDKWRNLSPAEKQKILKKQRKKKWR